MKIIGVGGPSCSGKSTFSRHLRHLLPNAAILYEDDFYLPESELPLDVKGLPNWDCPESFDILKMRQRILQLKRDNQLPNQVTREEHNNNSGSYLLSTSQITEIQTYCSSAREPVLLVDGIMLFHHGSEVADLFDLKILFPFNYEELKRRREARSGYETSEGFWQDPPNYFDEFVWPEFIKHHKHLYVEGGEGQYFTLSKSARDNKFWMPSSTDMYIGVKELISKLIECMELEPRA